MRSPPRIPLVPLAPLATLSGRYAKQRGVVLFFALISLLAIMLAAVALVRSVDTSTIIAGNLAFKQAATSSGDAGTEAAIAWLTATEAANNSLSVYTDTTHAFNNDNPAAGYYSSVNPNLSLTASSGTRITWTDADSVLVLPDPDSSGNSVRYVIQRMCRTANVVITAVSAQCLFSGALQDTNGKNIPLPQDICKGAGCPQAGQSPQIRITSRITGPKNTISYVQAFVY
jgi:type IV pilus assembly protein PilX